MGPELGKGAGRRAEGRLLAWIQVRKALSLTTSPVSNMCPWKSPQSSAQRIEKLRTSVGRT